ncbi:MAG: amino acid ABC transporter substrate-binding protein [Candidatus Sericytochromatia bacterium]|nr:amino acid ABC transporter substrate-binding protein [Candidatus Sericytochromatia bacterium]
MKRLIAVTALLLAVGCAPAKSDAAAKATSLGSASPDSGDAVDADGSLARIRKAGVLRVGADLQSGLPFWAPGHNPEDPPNGFEAGLADVIAQSLGVTAKAVPTKWMSLLPGLASDQYDIVLNGIEAPSPADAAKLDTLSFSRPYVNGGEWIVVPPEDKTSERLSDLKGMHVGVVTNSVDSALLEAANKQHKLDIKIVTKPDTKELFKQLEARSIEAALLPQPMAALFLVQNPTFRPAGKPFMETGYVVGARRGDKALLNAIDAWLAKRDADKAYQTLTKKWKMTAGD